MTTVDPTPPPAPPAYFKSTFSRWVTIVLGVLLALIFALISKPGTPEESVRALEHPVRTAERFFERDLEIHDALNAMPAWMRRLGEIVFETSSESLSGAIQGYQDVLAAMPAQPNASRAAAHPGREPSSDLDELRARLAILMEESGRSDDAREQLALLDEAGEAELADLVRVAYGERSFEPSLGIDAFDLDRLGPGWAKDRLLEKLASRTGDAAHARSLRDEAARRDAHWHTRVAFLTFAYLVPCLLGLAAFLWWLWKDRPPVLRASALIPPAWGWDDGCGVLVRSAFAGMLLSGAIFLSGQALGVKVFSLWIELFASLPMLWWIWRALLRPHQSHFGRAFGLWPERRRTSTPPVLASFVASEKNSAEHAPEPSLARRMLGWTAMALALLALDQLGAAVIEIACRRFGIEPHWSEGVQESLIWSSNRQALLGAMDGALWAPIFEEIGCRGLLYLTLRTRSGPQVAALFSASLFSMVHMYSLPGFLSVMWSGYLWAIAFENCRSLVPGMVCHALWNGFLFVNMFMFYR